MTEGEQQLEKLYKALSKLGLINGQTVPWKNFKEQFSPHPKTLLTGVKEALQTKEGKFMEEFITLAQAFGPLTELAGEIEKEIANILPGSDGGQTTDTQLYTDTQQPVPQVEYVPSQPVSQAVQLQEHLLPIIGFSAAAVLVAILAFILTRGDTDTPTGVKPPPPPPPPPTGRPNNLILVAKKENFGAFKIHDGTIEITGDNKDQFYNIPWSILPDRYSSDVENLKKKITASGDAYLLLIEGLSFEMRSFRDSVTKKEQSDGFKKLEGKTVKILGLIDMKSLLSSREFPFGLRK